MYFDSYATGKRIQHLRKVKGMTQEELAIKLNISDRHLRSLERGEYTPSVDLFVEIVEFFTFEKPHEQTYNHKSGNKRDRKVQNDV